MESVTFGAAEAGGEGIPMTEGKLDCTTVAEAYLRIAGEWLALAMEIEQATEPRRR